MLKIRLTRVGKKNSPAYRVVVADQKRAVKRKFIEIIGHYSPTLKPKEIVISKERAIFWMNQGAQASDTVNNLMVDLQILAKDRKINKVYGKKLSKKATKEGGAEKKEPVAETEIATPEAEVTEPEAEAEEKSESALETDPETQTENKEEATEASKE